MSYVFGIRWNMHQNEYKQVYVWSSDSWDSLGYLYKQDIFYPLKSVVSLTLTLFPYLAYIVLYQTETPKGVVPPELSPRPLAHWSLAHAVPVTLHGQQFHACIWPVLIMHSDLNQFLHFLQHLYTETNLQCIVFTHTKALSFHDYVKSLLPELSYLIFIIQ